MQPLSTVPKDAKIYIAGHQGLVGSSLLRRLKQMGYGNLILRERGQVDLTEQAAVNYLFKDQRPEFVIVAAARVGGILYNQRYQAEFLYENLMISANVMHAAHEFDVKKLVYLGSSCIYPKLAPQPLKEEYLLSGPLEPSNEGYALAKIAGLKMCEKYMEQYQRRFVSVMPTNLYGPGDNFHPEHSHVIPGMMRRFHHAKVNNLPEVVIWGSGTPKREFLYVDDLASAVLFVLDCYEGPGTINVGTGVDQSIAELADLMAATVGYDGKIVYDRTKPDGTPRKVLDVSRINHLGWGAKVQLKDGLAQTYRWAQEQDIFA